MSQETRVSHPTYNLLPTEIEGFDLLAELALDMRWSWNHATDELWRQLDPALWELTHNPWVVLIAEKNAMHETKFTTSRILDENGSRRGHKIGASTTNRSILVGFAIILAVIILLIARFELRFNWAASATLVVMSALILALRITRQKRALQKGQSEDSRCSAQIEADIFTRLGVSSVTSDTSNGVVILHGTVPYPNLRVAAEQLALRAGVRRVVNRLTIEQPAHIPTTAARTNLTIVTTSEGVSGRCGVQPVREALDERAKAGCCL